MTARIENGKINELLGITESYKAPEKMMSSMLDENLKEHLFSEFLKIESDLSYEWFQGYFEAEHADRKEKKQDFTPDSVSKLGTSIIGHSDKYFEAAAGTGGMAINFWNENKNTFFELEELSDRAIPFLLFNMAIRNIEGTLLHGDSLSGEIKAKYHLEKSETFSRISESPIIQKFSKTNVLMNPPFSASWNQKNDERFEDYGLAPKTKADFAFLLHGFSKLSNDGTMAIVLPHGVLFRGAAEGKIRQKLLEKGAIDSIIGLPANIFYGTSIPTVMIVLKKNRSSKDVYFIDASKEFEKEKAQNSMKSEHVDKILIAYKNREEIEKFAHLASFEEIKENDFNLNIPRFVDTFEQEKPIDLYEVATDLIELDREIAQSENKLLEMLAELTGPEELMPGLEATKEYLRGGKKGQMSLFD
ncbi:MAG: N-6 DNA methylase [Lactococcus lactis]